eukprot:1419664-Rhodomonas_salina.1
MYMYVPTDAHPEMRTVPRQPAPSKKSPVTRLRLTRHPGPGLGIPSHAGSSTTTSTSGNLRGLKARRDAD